MVAQEASDKLWQAVQRRRRYEGVEVFVDVEIGLTEDVRQRPVRCFHCKLCEDARVCVCGRCVLVFVFLRSQRLVSYL